MIGLFNVLTEGMMPSTFLDLPKTQCRFVQSRVCRPHWRSPLSIPSIAPFRWVLPPKLIGSLSHVTSLSPGRRMPEDGSSRRREERQTDDDEQIIRHGHQWARVCCVDHGRVGGVEMRAGSNSVLAGPPFRVAKVY